MPHIEFQGVSKAYRGQTSLRDVSFTVERGERVTMLGPSGCGKTTLLRLLAGLSPPDAGRILIDEVTVAAAGRVIVEPEHRNIGMVFQDLALWPHMTVDGNLKFGLRARRVHPNLADERVREILRLTEIESAAQKKPGELSGGEQQRVALARALVLAPPILLMDEPLSSLNPELNVRLRKQILTLHEKFQFTLLYVTHNRDEAFELGTRVIVVVGGRIAAMGSPAEIRSAIEAAGGTERPFS